ncbi:hypothetical protein [Colwellia sp. MEBiC06753]
MNGSYHCHHCLKFLTGPQYLHSKYCNLPDCQRAKARVAIERKRQQQLVLEEQLVQEVHSKGDQVNEYHPSDGKLGRTLVGLVPSNVNVLKKVPKIRIKRFTQHLTQVLQHNVESHKNFPYSQSDHQIIDQQQDPVWLATACATCKGHCCRLGKDHGFLDFNSIIHVKNNLGTRYSDGEIVNLYQSYIVDESIENSCIFQGGRGCRLPHELRSLTCKRYLCEQVKSIIASDKAHPAKTIYFGAVSDESLHRIDIFKLP